MDFTMEIPMRALWIFYIEVKKKKDKYVAYL